MNHNTMGSGAIDNRPTMDGGSGAAMNSNVQVANNVERMNEAIQRMQTIFNKLDKLLGRMNQNPDADALKGGEPVQISLVHLMQDGPGEIHNRIDDIMNQIEMVERGIYGG